MQATGDAAADRGAVLVEFGLLLPVMAGLLLGIVTSGLAFFAKLEMATAAQEAARALHLGADVATATAVATSPATGTVSVTSSSDGSVTSTWTCTGNSGDLVTVSISRTMTIRYLIGSFNVTVPARAVSRCA